MLGISSPACAPLTPVAHAPWVEDPSLELTRELLELEVGSDSVSVRAWFRFTPRSPEAARRSHAMVFAVGEAAGPAEVVRAELVEPGGRRIPLETRPSHGASLPAPDARQELDFTLPDAALAPGSWLLVSYRQRAADHFGYVLASGAYWSGPIGQLEVVVIDPLRRVLDARVEGRSATQRTEGARGWSFSALEPREPVALTLR